MNKVSLNKVYYDMIIRNRLFSKYNYKRQEAIPELLQINLRYVLKGLDSVENIRVINSIKLLEMVGGKKPLVISDLAAYVRGKRQVNVIILTTLRRREMAFLQDYLINIVLPLRAKWNFLEKGYNPGGLGGDLFVQDVSMFYDLRTRLGDFSDKMEIRYLIKRSKPVECRDLLVSLCYTL